jgi:hypothetical protein
MTTGQGQTLPDMIPWQACSRIESDGQFVDEQLPVLTRLPAEFWSSGVI